MALRLCLVCGTPANGSRCPVHKLRSDSRTKVPYGREHKAITARTIAAWVQQNGWVCPGFRRGWHPVPVGGLEGEHIISRHLRPDLANDPSNYSVLCRRCNARKGARVD